MLRLVANESAIILGGSQMMSNYVVSVRATTLVLHSIQDLLKGLLFALTYVKSKHFE